MSEFNIDFKNSIEETEVMSKLCIKVTEYLTDTD